MWKRRIGWLLMLLAALCMYLFENNGGTRVILAVVLLLPVCSALSVWLFRPVLSAELAVPETLARGESARCVLTLKNGAPVPLPSVRCALSVENLLTGEECGLTITSALGARRTAEAGFSITAVHCGKVTVRVASLELADLFGLFARRVPCQLCRTATVPPVASPVELSLADDAGALADSQRYSPLRPGRDPSETFRIREYVPGDPIRQIHWKLSQKTDAVLVRDFGLPAKNGVLLLLETTALPGVKITPENADDMLDLLDSLSRALLALDVPHTVGWQEGASGVFQSWEVHGEDDLAALLDLVLANRIGSGDTTVTGCYGQSGLEYAYAHAAVLSPYLQPDISALCHGSRVTALLPCRGEPWPDGWESGAYIILYTAGELPRGGFRLVL